MSGAGGPVLVMPLLVVMGISVRTAVGVALFNSVFIGIPAVTGYLAQCDIKKASSGSADRSSYSWNRRIFWEQKCIQDQSEASENRNCSFFCGNCSV